MFAVFRRSLKGLQTVKSGKNLPRKLIMSSTMHHSEMFIRGCLTATWYGSPNWEHVSLDLLYSHCDSASKHLCKLSEVLCPNESPDSHCWCQTLNYHLFFPFKVSKYHGRFPLYCVCCLNRPIVNNFVKDDPSPENNGVKFPDHS